MGKHLPLSGTFSQETNRVEIVALPNNAFDIVLVNIIPMVVGLQELLAADLSITQVRPLADGKAEWKPWRQDT